MQLRDLGIPDKMTRVIAAIYQAPNYIITEKGTTTRPRIQKTGIRQGCPLSPYLFIMLMTVIMHDADRGMSEDENRILQQGKLHKEVSGRLFYADDTIVTAKTAEAAEIALHNTIGIIQVRVKTKRNQMHPHSNEWYPEDTLQQRQRSPY